MSRHHEYSQHFLSGPRLIAELIGHSNIRKNDTVYDLGAGSGVITSVLARRCKQVVAVEVEQQALKKLRQNVENLENVTIIQKDILQLPIPSEPYKIFSNIPFSLSAEIVRKFTSATNPPKSMYLVAQKQFARKLVPGSDHFTSQLSAEISPWFTVRIRKPLRKTDFTPPPAVDTVLLEIKQRETPIIAPEEAEDYREFVTLCFTRQKYFISLEKDKAGLSPELRPSQLTIEQWVRLYATVKA
ncbi:MAG TPA: rRNA adenine dimethyltransferase family protein [Candidatus Saccharimonadales bacterium]